MRGQPRTFRRRGPATASVALILLAAACGGGGAEQTADTSAARSAPAATEPATSAAPAPSTPAAPTPTASAASAGAAVVATADSSLGEVLVDGDGFTLYLFENDTQGESACTDDCAATWPPLTGEATAGEGADASMLGAITRADGSTQTTYNGHPLYRFAPDEAPGDVNGQGVGEVWWVVSPEGEPIKDSGSASESAAGY